MVSKITALHAEIVYSIMQKYNCIFSHSCYIMWVMMTSSNGNIFRVTGPLCGEFTGPGEFPTQRSVMRSFYVFFVLRLNKRLNKQPWGWWFETPSWSLWRHCNVVENSSSCKTRIRLFYMVDTIAADDLVTHRPRSSAAMILNLRNKHIFVLHQ